MSLCHRWSCRLGAAIPLGSRKPSSKQQLSLCNYVILREVRNDKETKHDYRNRQRLRAYSTPTGRLVFQICGVFAEFERSMSRQRISADISLAKLGNALRPWLAQRLPHCRPLLERALAGDKDAAGELCLEAPNGLRGSLVLAAYYSGTPNPGYQEIIRSVWNHDHRVLMKTVQNREFIPRGVNRRELVRCMIAAAQFEHPLSGSLRAFRGASGVTLRKAANGLSWTLSRDVACWFARRFAPESSRWIVVVADIDASDVIFWDDDRLEQEIVLKRRVRASIDANPGTWALAADRHENRKQEGRLIC